MADNRQEWEIEQLKDLVKGLKEGQTKHHELLAELALFKATTVDKLLLIFAKLEELREGDRWIKRIFVTALIGAILSAVASLIVWAFTT